MMLGLEGKGSLALVAYSQALGFKLGWCEMVVGGVWVHLGEMGLECRVGCRGGSLCKGTEGACNM